MHHGGERRQKPSHPPTPHRHPETNACLHDSLGRAGNRRRTDERTVRNHGSLQLDAISGRLDPADGPSLELELVLEAERAVDQGPVEGLVDEVGVGPVQPGEHGEKVGEDRPMIPDRGPLGDRDHLQGAEILGLRGAGILGTPETHLRDRRDRSDVELERLSHQVDLAGNPAEPNGPEGDGVLIHTATSNLVSSGGRRVPRLLRGAPTRSIPRNCPPERRRS